VLLNFRQMWWKMRGWCPECGETRDRRGLQWKYIDGKMRGVECQDKFHGERTIQPGVLCNDHEGNTVTMPD
jgi:hypothetical protein